ncbi:unnamed protein product [Lepeophtheirus salmonis]|uniref:(salmon louse) hypothetical protein n=1 Tax=Lepeophtheirus salmonis TaxID=72036 RepID=A0A7R8HAX4_LEPSM|nr:unnamed protein product [Lepeophtheirus salmonis]CAF2976559.1 unnamed protein product [Lepeophtheirus salmonis]
MRLPVPIVLRGGSEPPRDTNPRDYKKKTPFRVGNVLNASTDNISLEDTKNGSVSGVMPFGSSENDRKSKGTRTTQKRRTSVGNIVAALEAEIRSRKEREGSLEPKCSGQTSEDRPLPSYIYGIGRGSINQGLNNLHDISIRSPSFSSSSSLESNTSPINPRKCGSSQPWMSKGSIYSTLSQYNQDNEEREGHVANKESHSNYINRLGYVCNTSHKDYKEESVISQITSNHFNSYGMSSIGNNDFQVKSMNNKQNGHTMSSDSETSIKSYLEKEMICNEDESEPENNKHSEIRIKAPSKKQSSTTKICSNSSTDLVNYSTRFEEEWEEHSEEITNNSYEQSSIFLTECNPEDKIKSTYTVKAEERKGMEDLFEELVAKTKIKRDETQSTLFTEDTFFNDLVKTDTGTITGLEDHEGDISSSTDDIHSMMSPTNKNPDDNSYEIDTSDDKAIIFKYKSHFPLRNRRKSVSDLDPGTKLRNKRKRNRTIEVDSWQGTVCQYTQRTYLQEEKTTKVEEKTQNTETYSSKVKNVEQDLEQGLEIIIDRLRNIETKLDELKTMETSHTLMNPSATRKNEDVHVEEEVCIEEKKSPGLNDQSDITNEEDSSMLHYAINCQNEEFLEENKVPENEIQGEEDEEDDDDTLKDEYINDNASILSERTEIICIDDDITGDEMDIPDDYRISSPAVSVNCSVGRHRSRNLEIISLSSVDDDCNGPMFTETEEETEDEEDILRKQRIEKLAQQLLEENLVHHNENDRVERPSYMKLDLDTVSERSEDDTDFDSRKSPESKKKNLPTRRTRSESRERTLHRIKYCWRCHNTGHESFDCRIEPQPGSWCPRCLEVSHWEDQCWVNDTEVFCNVCSLPGHLPCVHQTNDFRQRKLVIETFGWLSFKEWFREVEFWSWWNISGFTNVPLYKLMQHRPGEVAPN